MYVSSVIRCALIITFHALCELDRADQKSGDQAAAVIKKSAPAASSTARRGFCEWFHDVLDDSVHSFIATVMINAVVSLVICVIVISVAHAVAHRSHHTGGTKGKITATTPASNTNTLKPTPKPATTTTVKKPPAPATPKPKAKAKAKRSIIDQALITT